MTEKLTEKKRHAKRNESKEVEKKHQNWQRKRRLVISLEF
jgi:hypothetical protein